MKNKKKILSPWLEPSLRRSLNIGMVLVAMVPLLLMALQGYHCARQAVVDQQNVILDNHLQERKTRIEDWFRQYRDRLRFVASLPCTREACCRTPGRAERAGSSLASGACAGFLDRFFASNPANASVVLYDARGRVVAAAAGNPPDESGWLPAGFLKTMIRAGDEVTSVQHGHADGRVDIHFGVRVYGSNGEPAGFLVTGVDVIRALHSIFCRRARPVSSTRLFLILPGGQIFRGPPEDALVPVGNGAKPFPLDLFAKHPGKTLRFRPADGEMRLGRMSRLPDLGWTLVVDVSTREAFKWLRILKFRALGMALATFALVLLLARAFSRRLTWPLHRLVHVAREIANGHYERRVPLMRRKEPREVALAFNRMLDELDGLRRELVQSATLSAVGELSSSIVHEMRNPLSSIKMNLAALEKKVADDPLHAELADIASRQVARLERMLTDLLHFGRPVTLALRRLEAGPLAREVLRYVEPAAAAAAVSLEARLEPEDGIVTADPEQLRRVLINLLENAIQATPAGGRITLSIRGFEVPGRDRVEIEVRDTGPGLDEAVAARVFQPFFTTRESGVGLGLAYVKKIVELHGGTIRAASPPEGGAVFTIVLPSRRSPRNEETADR